MKKKLLHIVEAFGGGVYFFLLDLSNKLSYNFDITIAYARRPETPEDFESSFSKNIKLIELKSAGRSIDPVKDIKFYFETKKIVKELQPDIIHLHSSKAGFVGRAAINCKKHMVFYTPHGYAFRNGNHGRIFRRLEKLAARSHALTIAVSKTEYDSAVLLGAKAAYVNNGIDIKNMPSLKKPDFDTIRICTLGRISEQKNPALFSQIAAAFPDISFTWIGEGELRDELQNDNISIAGWQPRQNALEILCRNNVFIMTSLWEGLPIALLEAMYLQRLCIVNDIEGTRDVIKSGINGFLADSLESYIKIISSIVGGDIDTDLITKNAHNDVIKEYNSEVMVKRYADIYYENERAGK